MRTFVTRAKWGASALSLLTVTSMALVACGSEGTPSASPTTPELDGAPVRIMVIDDATTPGDTDFQAFVGAKAGAMTVNNKGGINGGPVKIIECDTDSDANKAADCARKAVKDDVVGVIALTGFGDSYMPILEKAGIPSVANGLVAPAELSSELSFPIMGGFLPFVAGATTILADQGASKINFAVADVGSSAEAATGFAKIGLKTRDLRLHGTTLVPPGAPDFATHAAAALKKGTDGVALATDPEDTPRLIRALREADPDVLVASNTQSMRADGLRVLGDAADGVLLVSNFLPVSDKSPEMKTFVKNMDAVHSDTVKGDLAINAYLGVELIAKALDGARTADAKTLVAELNDVDGLDLVLAPPIQFKAPRDVLPGVSRLFSTQLTYLQVKDGKVVQISDGFVDPFAPRGN